MDNNDLEMDREILIRRTRLLYPEIEDWCIEMAVDAYIKNGGKKVEVNEDEVLKVKNNMFQGIEYAPYK